MFAYTNINNLRAYDDVISQSDRVAKADINSVDSTLDRNAKKKNPAQIRCKERESSRNRMRFFPRQERNQLSKFQCILPIIVCDVQLPGHWVQFFFFYNNYAIIEYKRTL